MSKPREGESIHNLIFRTHQVNGINSYENLLTNSGRLLMRPPFLDETQKLYGGLDALDVMKLMSSMTYYAQQKLVQPEDFNLVLDHFFRRQRWHPDKINSKTRLSFPINYCLPCIEDQIVEYGFGFLKKDWLNNDYCFSHRRKLYQLKANTQPQSAEGLRQILRGVHPANVGYKKVISKKKKK